MSSDDYLEQMSTGAQAAHWWVVLRDEACTDAERRAFSAWIQRSPDRVEAYLHVISIHHELVSPQRRWPSAPTEELIREARSDAGAILNGQWTRVREVRTKRRWRLRSPGAKWLTVAAVVVLATAASVWALVMRPAAPFEYETALGEQRSVLLGDGSVITLNTRSRATVRFTSEVRKVSLERGEALFNVAKDARRPFVVDAGGTTIRAVGTEFNVRRTTAEAEITVVEGKVRVTPTSVNSLLEPGPQNQPLLVGPGEQLVISRQGVPAMHRLGSVGRVTAWVQRQLVFDTQPLSEVVAEFNRYNPHPLVIADPELAQKKISGVFAANDPDSLVAFLRRLPGVTVHESATHERIIERSSAGPSWDVKDIDNTPPAEPQPAGPQSPEHQ